jgi:hypothetical protein
MSAPVLDDPSTGEAVNFWRSRISNHVADPYDRAQLDALDRALVTVHTRAVAS